ncbi:MAG: aspartate/glutamate racemase family protein [Acidimicrobiales bacterium]|nr:aspartate/glutamate racemase family protein [Acidimicrobiales bacterium]
METIGLIGGMSWESTAEYYRLINLETQRRRGGHHSARLVLWSVDFAEIEEMQAAGRWDDAGALLAETARRLEWAGAGVLGLCTNTMHKVADVVAAAVEVPLVHLGDVTARAVRDAGLSTVGLLGTAFTMEQPFYRRHLESHGLTVLVPDDADRAEVHRVIYEELVHGVVDDGSRHRYREVIERFVDAGAEGVIFGCTEIELLVGADDSSVAVFPTTHLHASALVDAALADGST